MSDSEDKTTTDLSPRWWIWLLWYGSIDWFFWYVWRPFWGLFFLIHSIIEGILWFVVHIFRVGFVNPKATYYHPDWCYFAYLWMMFQCPDSRHCHRDELWEKRRKRHTVRVPPTGW